jgi:hypothetical protein
VTSVVSASAATTARDLLSATLRVAARSGEAGACNREGDQLDEVALRCAATLGRDCGGDEAAATRKERD